MGYGAFLCNLSKGLQSICYATDRMHLIPRRTKLFPTHRYSLTGSQLSVTNSQKDIGIKYDSHFSFRPHAVDIVTKASHRAKLILSCFISRQPQVFWRPLLLLLDLFWSIYLLCGVLILKTIYTEMDLFRKSSPKNNWRV